jgi:hypothetical protein
VKVMCFYRPDVLRHAPPNPEFMARMQVYVEASYKSGRLHDTGGLEPGDRGVRVRRSGDKITITESPLPPATTVIAGWAVIAAPTLAAAIEHAKNFLALVSDGETEVRPMWVMPGTPAQYLMVYRPEGPEREITPRPEQMAAMGKYVTDLKQAGVLVSTGSVGPTSASKIVRLTAGKRTVIDGPFAEAKEMIAGFAVLEVPSIAAAIEHTAEFLALAGDGISEVRPLH